MTYITSNETHNFFLQQVGKKWYAIAVTKETEERTLASFSAKKVALNAIESWKGWM